VVLLVLSGGAANAALGQCVSDTIGVPVSLANGIDWNSFGSANGQSFWAADTLIESITIWRPANYGPIALGLNLFITKAYLTHPILVDGGVVRVYDSDPPGLPVPMTWTKPFGSIARSLCARLLDHSPTLNNELF